MALPARTDYNPFAVDDVDTSTELSTVSDGVVLNSVLANAYSQIGHEDKKSKEEYTGIELNFPLIEQIVGKSMIAYKAATTLPMQALLTFRGWTKTKEVDAEFQQQSYEWFLDNLLTPLIEAAVKGRIYGDGFLILGFDDGQAMDKPLNIPSISAFHGAFARSREYVTPTNGIDNIEDSEFFHVSRSSIEGSTEKKFYAEIDMGTSGMSTIVHRSRILYFPGLLDFSDSKHLRSGGNKSVFSFCGKEIEEYGQAVDQIMRMLKTHSTYVLEIDGLVQGTRRNNVTELATRFVSLIKTITLFGAVIVDAKKEKANIINRTYTGVETLLKQIETSLTNTSDLPASYLITANDSQFSDKSIGDRYAMSQLIDNYYLTHLRKPLNYLYTLYCALTGHETDSKPGSFKISRVSSLILTRHEEAEVQFKHAQRDILYTIPVDPEDPMSAILYPEDIRTRWESAEYSDEITLDPTIVRTRDINKIREVVKAKQDQIIKGDQKTAPVKRGGLDVGQKGLKTASTENGRSAYTRQYPT
jgi:hypothetical protein